MKNEFRQISVGFVLGLLSLLSCQTIPQNPWAKATTPFGDSQSPKAIGRYSAGCLVGAEALPQDGEGFHWMSVKQGRRYGHPKLIGWITRLGRKISKTYSVDLLVGDLSQPRGGPTPSGHKSHQIGLDVDLWYQVLSHQNGGNGGDMATHTHWRTPGEEVAPESVLTSDGSALNWSDWTPKTSIGVSKGWSSVQLELLKEAAQSDEVDRIFVHPVIKLSLCRKFAQQFSPKVLGIQAIWLRKLRPWWGHQDHFHVRLKCPQEDHSCVPQESLPEGSGCDTAALSWWFSEEASRAGTALEDIPKMPAECQALLES